MKIVSRLFFLLVLSLLCFLGCKIYKKASEKKETAGKVAALPAFEFISTGGRRVSQQETAGKPLWLILFHSECDYCKMEAENIRKTPALQQVNVWMVSSETRGELQRFSNKYGLDTLAYVTILSDTAHVSNRIFNTASTPASFLYNQKGELIKSYKGVVKAEAVLREL